MDIDWPREFDQQFDRIEADQSERGKKIYDLLAFMFQRLRQLDHAPETSEETATLKWVRQSRRHIVWRVSHPYTPGIALRLICWFPPDGNQVVVALFAGDKSNMGDVFYDSVGTRADQLIDRWLDEMETS